jgi:hypothetical protein
MSEEPIRLETIVGMTAVFFANPAFGGHSAIEPILTLNLVDQSGRIVLLPLADTALAKILDTLKRFEQGLTGLPGLEPFEPPKAQ